MMKKLTLMMVLILLCSVSLATAGELRAIEKHTPMTYDEYLTQFDYKARKVMKIDSKELIKLLEEGKAVLVDIRFKEEHVAWRTGLGEFIPLNELPKRYTELPKDKIIVTACPHSDRSNIAAQYLRLKGYDAKYLTDGLLGLFENLRGDNAKNFIKKTGIKMP